MPDFTQVNSEDIAILALGHFVIVFIFFACAQLYLANGCRRWLNKNYSSEIAHRYNKIGLAFIILSNLLFCARYMFIEVGLYEHTLIQGLVIYPGGVLFAALGISLVAMLFIDLTRLTRTIHGKIQFSNTTIDNHDSEILKKHYSPSRRQFIKSAGMAMAGAPFGIAIGSASATAHDYRIIREDLFFETLPVGLEGLKIAQISDIHSGIYMTQSQIQEIFEITNSLNPNLVTITGDFIDTSINELPALYNTVSILKSDFGTFGCLGNHDHYGSGKAVSSAMQQQGVNMLVNGNTSLRINDENLSLIGVDDYGSGKHDRARLDDALRGINPDTFKILLSHRPDLFDSACQNNIDLTLSGHTHGGQIGMDIFGVPFYPARLLYNYSDGLYQKNDKKLYVNVGVGMVGIPIRMVKPEITLITLRTT
ncbi:MAG: metallophosphoesterase [Balneolales bacterium]